MSIEPKFVDTDVLVYLLDADSSKKQARARDLLREERDRLILSVQVLGKFFVTVTRKLAVPLSTDVANRAVDALCELQVEILHLGLVRAAPQDARWRDGFEGCNGKTLKRGCGPSAKRVRLFVFP